jgi:Uma2 family endonuclease
MFVIEISSRSTRRRDRGEKRKFYLDVGVPDYWIVDRERRAIQIVRATDEDVVEFEQARWHPAGAGTVCPRCKGAVRRGV